MSRRPTTDDSMMTIELDRSRSGVGVAEREPLWRRTISIVFTIAVIAITIYLWPALLGGSTRVVIVSGRSMEPTYDLRDIVVARDAGDTRVGDVVVFEVPEGKAEGMLIIHRVLEIDDDGFFITQGDNRTTPDQWQLTEENIVGKPLVHIPKGGKVLSFIQNIWVIALLAGIVVLFVMWPDDDEEDDEESVAPAVSTVAPTPVRAAAASSGDDTDAFERDATWTLVDSHAVLQTVATQQAAALSVDPAPIPSRASTPDELAQRWLDAELELDHEIDDDVMAEAMTWLDEQLEGFGQPVVH